ncbi:hypothetical protein QE417_003713 [Mucilaginibacter terrae]|uniref:Uncharacterized protein n=1 Tax=Mucilaginibacter terrae TaxID=1955052 RepID=A0ABU3GXY8_9SPHI|nr:hypothetical protein [Mucilaginibacter terrae]
MEYEGALNIVIINKNALPQLPFSPEASVFCG